MFSISHEEMEGGMNGRRCSQWMPAMGLGGFLQVISFDAVGETGPDRQPSLLIVESTIGLRRNGGGSYSGSSWSVAYPVSSTKPTPETDSSPRVPEMLTGPSQ